MCPHPAFLRDHVEMYTVGDDALIHSTNVIVTYYVHATGGGTEDVGPCPPGASLSFQGGKLEEKADANLRQVEMNVRESINGMSDGG